MSFVEVTSGAGIPLEAIMIELILSGEIERNYRLLRRKGYAGQMRYHSPASQYGQVSGADRYAALDVSGVMREVLSEIESSKFADEWDAERDAQNPSRYMSRYSTWYQRNAWMLGCGSMARSVLICACRTNL